MSDVKKYGRTALEKQLEKSHQCRQIISEILNFGVDEFQKLKVIYLLSLELEDRDALLKISKACRDFIEEDEEKTKENTILTV